MSQGGRAFRPQSTLVGVGSNPASDNYVLEYKQIKIWNAYFKGVSGLRFAVDLHDGPEPVSLTRHCPSQQLDSNKYMIINQLY